MNQVRIITELEKEKKKMQDDVQKLKDAKVTMHLGYDGFIHQSTKHIFFCGYVLFIFLVETSLLFYFLSKTAKR